METSPEKTVLWSKNEKVTLLSALYKFGPDDLVSLQKRLPNKSLDAIAKRLNHYKRLAKKDHVVGEKLADDFERRRSFRNNKVWPYLDHLDRWVVALTSSCSLTESSTQLPNALRLIALLEDHKQLHDTANVDFKSLYLFLADVIEGKPVDEINPDTTHFLIRHLISLSIKVKKGSFSQQYDYAQSITRVFPNAKMQTVNRDTPVSNALRNILSSVTYNPLEIPEKFLFKLPQPH